MPLANLKPGALTSLKKVNSFLGIADTDQSYDYKIGFLINAASDFIESMTNRKFFQQTYSQEMYDTDGGRYIYLRALPVISVSLIEYRGGSSLIPIWTALDGNYYYVYPGDYGMIKFFGALPHNGAQQLRVTYVGGYLIDFANEMDLSKHNLPFDLCQLATEIAAQNFTTSGAHGFKLESIEAQRQEYDFKLSPMQQAVLDKYSKQRLAM